MSVTDTKKRKEFTFTNYSNFYCFGTVNNALHILGTIELQITLK